MRSRLAALRIAVCLGVAGSVAGVTASSVRLPQKNAVAVRPAPTPRSAPTPAQAAKPTPAPVSGPGAWSDVERLVKEQKLSAALDRVGEILAGARQRRDSKEWTRALIRSVQLRTGLHGYETAVRFLKDEQWPPDLLSRAALELFYARSLVTYAQTYSWEVNQRERVESSGKVDLKAWTREQIYDEAVRAYLRLWKERAALGRESVDALSDFVEPNNYPRDVRGTLRDELSYFFVSLLADTSGWSPAQSNAVWALDLAGLLRADERSTASVPLDDPKVHPLDRLVAVTADLEEWHASRGEREGAFEARLERLRRLHAAFSRPEDDAKVIADLEARLPAMSGLPWFSVGKADLAEFVRDPRREGDLVRARRIALEGASAYPNSVGGQHCRSTVVQIELPSYQLGAMQSDAASRRSILVTHRNISHLWFRAYPVDLVARVAAAKNLSEVLPTHRELEDLVDREPAARWTVELPATPDYRDHQTFVTPPMTAKGLYVVMAVGGDRQPEGSYPLVATTVLVSDLVMVVPQNGVRSGVASELEVRAVEGGDGRPAAGADVSLLKGYWNPVRVERLGQGRTDERGFVSLPFPDDHQYAPRFLFARRGADLAYDTNVPWPSQEPEPRTTASLVFTDRAIYRPQQSVLWKVLAYRGDASAGRLEVSPRTQVTVSLVDQNNQSVASRMVTTNDFGSASGEFPIPAGRALGNWRVETSLNGSAGIRVEEYKRPTFEVTLDDPKEPLRLNRPARLRGAARYYFGLPVARGEVRWHVTRTPVYPWWWGWWMYASYPTEPETIASGSSELQADGAFTLAFTPAADERAAADRKGVTYSYTVEADASDEGGETRSASRAFRLGFTSVEARFEVERGFLRANERERVKVVRTSLDGVPRAGTGRWRLIRVEQPSAAVRPADLPPDPRQRFGFVMPLPRPGGYETPGDRLRPRWTTDYAPERILPEWPDAVEVARGEVTHDAKGEAWIPVGALPPGAYRIRYSTTDEFGAEFEAPRDLVVAGDRTPLALAALLLVESPSVRVGQTARVLAASGIPGQRMTLELQRDGKTFDRRDLTAGESPSLIEIPIREKDRGGFGVKLTAVTDHQFVALTQSVFVPWDDKELKVSFATFRDRLRPGQRETWTVKVEGPGERTAPAAAELLAFMYDRSLDAFIGHSVPRAVDLYPNRASVDWSRATLGLAYFALLRGRVPEPPTWPALHGDWLKGENGYGVGGPGVRGAGRVSENVSMAAQMSVTGESPLVDTAAAPAAKTARREAALPASAPASGPPVLRSNFAETAFWQPHLLTGPDGTASIEFTVPDSVTSWNVWVTAVTRDLKGGSVQKEAKSVKDLMVRPYVPRFLREGDAAELKVVVNNATDRGLSGRVALEIRDAATSASALADFGLTPESATHPFSAAAMAGANVTFRLSAPRRVGSYAIQAVATAGDLSDGELRPVPVLPGRMQLAQSRFVALRGGQSRTMSFEDMAKTDDPSRVDEQLVVTVDGQLFYSLLSALPYLVNYPYECTEQTLNRFVSTGVVSSVFRDHPSVAAMAQELSKRDTRLEPWSGDDPNRRMALEETPWLEEARGGKAGGDLVRILDPRIAKADRETSLAKLRQAQTESGGFPWWAGGPPSEYMTLYILGGFARALEFGVDVPKDMAQAGFRYAGDEIKRELADCMHGPLLCEMATHVNYVLSSYPDESWYAGAFDEEYRKMLLAYSFSLWKAHPPLLKGQLALTLKRMGRPQDAKLVWDSVMDSAKNDPDLGTYFAPEDRSWLWYNDTVETQAFALRVLAELEPADARRHGLVQWLFLNKKLNHWKSTRATAEAIYAVVWYLKKENALSVREEVSVDAGGRRTAFVFEPDRYTGKGNQVVVPGEKLDPRRDSRVDVAKTGNGLAFASATWHFSTEKPPEEDRGDFFSVSRRYFQRLPDSFGWKLVPLADGVAVAVGDEIEVQVSLRTKHAAEYVHLRDPRPAGAEPESVLSRRKWDLGIAWYEETRDSGSNFFFEQLPAGEYTFKYRVRANMAGTFRVGPATVQSMYAPEFNAYSAGNVMTIGAGATH